MYDSAFVKSVVSTTRQVRRGRHLDLDLAYRGAGIRESTMAGARQLLRTGGGGLENR